VAEVAGDAGPGEPFEVFASDGDRLLIVAFEVQDFSEDGSGKGGADRIAARFSSQDRPASILLAALGFASRMAALGEAGVDPGKRRRPTIGFKARCAYGVDERREAPESGSSGEGLFRR
jgi:hypothetical protein